MNQFTANIIQALVIKEGINEVFRVHLEVAITTYSNRVNSLKNTTEQDFFKVTLEMAHIPVNSTRSLVILKSLPT